MGPTASGKTGLAERLGDRLDAKLIGADAFQIYRGLDVGTAKPIDKKRYRLIDILEPNEDFGLGSWLGLAQVELVRAFACQQNVIAVGGTGLYVRALFEEYASIWAPPDPELRSKLNSMPIDSLRKQLIAGHPDIAASIDLANPVRVRRALEKLQSHKPTPIALPAFKKLKIALNPSVEVLSARIEHRVFEMVHNGWVREVEQLREMGYHREDPGFRAIGYRAIWDHLEDWLSIEEATATTIVETRQYAKRQRTWLRSEPNLVEISATTEDDAFAEAVERIGSALM